MFLRKLFVVAMLLSCSRVYCMSNDQKNFIVSSKDLVGSVYRKLDAGKVRYAANLQDGSTLVVGESEKEGIRCALHKLRSDGVVMITILNYGANFYALQCLYAEQACQAHRNAEEEEQTRSKM